MYQIAWCLLHKPQPEWDAALEAYRQALELLAVPGQTTAQVAALNPRYTISLITALDSKGLYEEADAWAGMLKGTSFVEGDVTPGDEPLINRRRAYLALRSNDLDTALSLAQVLRDTAEHTYAMLLASIAYFAADRLKKARQAITTANPTQADVAWIRAIAIGWFNRYDPVKREEYLALLPG